MRATREPYAIQLAGGEPLQFVSSRAGVQSLFTACIPNVSFDSQFDGLVALVFPLSVVRVSRAKYLVSCSSNVRGTRHPEAIVVSTRANCVGLCCPSTFLLSLLSFSLTSGRVYWFCFTGCDLVACRLAPWLLGIVGRAFLCATNELCLRGCCRSMSGILLLKSGSFGTGLEGDHGGSLTILLDRLAQAGWEAGAVSNKQQQFRGDNKVLDLSTGWHIPSASWFFNRCGARRLPQMRVGPDHTSFFAKTLGRSRLYVFGVLGLAGNGCRHVR